MVRVFIFFLYLIVEIVYGVWLLVVIVIMIFWVVNWCCVKFLIVNFFEFLVFLIVWYIVFLLLVKILNVCFGDILYVGVNLIVFKVFKCLDVFVL